MQPAKRRLFKVRFQMPALTLPPYILRPKRAFADVLCIAILITLCVAIGWPRFRTGIDLGDEGCLAYGAVRVLEGQIPNRDFVTPQGPLSFYTIATVFKVLGTSLVSMRILGLAIFVLIPLLIYAISRCLMSRFLALAAAVPACVLGIPYFNFAPLAVWQGVASSSAAVLLYLCAIATKQMWFAVLSGALIAITLFLRHDLAVYVSVALVLYALIQRFTHRDDSRRQALRSLFGHWLAGAAIVIVPSAIFFLYVGAIPEMFRQLVVFPLTVYPKTSSVPFPKILPNAPLSENAWVMLFYVPPLVQLLAAIYLVRSIKRNVFCPRQGVLMFLITWSALFSFQALTRSDLEHLLPTLAPFFLLVCFAWSLLIEHVKKRRHVLAFNLSIAAAICASAWLFVVYDAAIPELNESAGPLRLARAGGLRIPQPEILTDFVHRLQAYVPPEHSILALPYEPMFYFLTERRNPTRWNYLWPGDQTAADHAHLIAEAERDPPDIVLLTIEHRFASEAQAVVQYVHDHYDLVAGNENDLNIYIRRQRDEPTNR